MLTADAGDGQPARRLAPRERAGAEIKFEQEMITQTYDLGWAVRKFTCQISPRRCEQFSLRAPGDNLAVVTLVRDRLTVMRFWFHYATPIEMRRNLAIANLSGLLQLAGHHDPEIRAYLSKPRRNREVMSKIEAELARLDYRLRIESQGHDVMR